LMRIMQVHTRYRERGGEDAVVMSEADLLRQAGHEVIQLHAHNPTSTPGAAAALAVAPWNPRAASRAYRTARDRKPDVAHVHNTWFAMSPAVLPALRDAGVPVVLTLHNYRIACANSLLLRDGRPCEECVGRNPWPGVRYRCYRDSAVASAMAALTISSARFLKAWSEVAVFIALSNFARERFVRAGLPPDRIVVKPHATMDPGPRRRKPSESSSLLFVGRLSAEKGVRLLFDAWEQARVSGLDLCVVGDGPAMAELRRRRVPGVRFTGWMEPRTVTALMLDARALVFPSVWYETFGLVMVEAMAAGLPVLASDLGGTAELLGEQARRWLVTPNDVDAWAAGLQRLADDETVDEGGEAGRRRYDLRFAPEHALTALESIYARAVASCAA
jgi:glycosyltransferase involved in cell wall biosynthesis